MKETLREREKSHEAKYKLGEELKFKAVARRNKLIGLWAAQRLGLNAPETVTYAKQAVGAGLAAAEGDGVVEKIVKDFQDRGLDIGEDEIRGEMMRLLAVARDQVADEYPKALGPDHARVGDWPT